MLLIIEVNNIILTIECSTVSFGMKEQLMIIIIDDKSADLKYGTCLRCFPDLVVSTDFLGREESG